MVMDMLMEAAELRTLAVILSGSLARNLKVIKYQIRMDILVKVVDTMVIAHTLQLVVVAVSMAVVALCTAVPVADQVI